jgi:hypothetical protein
LGEFTQTDSETVERHLACLDHMIMDALTCVPDCLAYMSLLSNPEIFRFCAVPQVMAIMTLATCYHNHQVFTGVVKIRKGMAVLMLQDVSSSTGLYKWFYLGATEILRKIPETNPTSKYHILYSKTRSLCEKIIQETKTIGQAAIIRSYCQVIGNLSLVGISSSLMGLVHHNVMISPSHNNNNNNTSAAAALVTKTGESLLQLISSLSNFLLVHYSSSGQGSDRGSSGVFSTSSSTLWSSWWTMTLAVSTISLLVSGIVVARYPLSAHHTHHHHSNNNNHNKKDKEE